MVIVKRLSNFTHHAQGDINEDVKGISCSESCFNFQNCQKVAFHSRKRSVYSTPIFNLRQCNCTGCVLVIRSTYVQIGATQLKGC